MIRRVSPVVPSERSTFADCFLQGYVNLEKTTQNQISEIYFVVGS